MRARPSAKRRKKYVEKCRVRIFLRSAHAVSNWMRCLTPQAKRHARVDECPPVCVRIEPDAGVGLAKETCIFIFLDESEKLFKPCNLWTWLIAAILDPPVAKRPSRCVES